MSKKIAVLFSGIGTNLDAICQYAQNTKEYEVALAITNNKNAKGIEIAKNYGVRHLILDHTTFSLREDFDKQLVAILQKEKLDLVVLAGFMRILTPIFTSQIKAVNIHPSLLPKYPGANAIEQTFNSKDTFGGITIHYVNEGVDEGEIIAQASVLKLDSDTIDSFRKRIHEEEWALYPKTIAKILKGE